MREGCVWEGNLVREGNVWDTGVSCVCVTLCVGHAGHG